MDLVEFAENVCGMNLPEWQKEYIRLVESRPEGSKLVMVRGSLIIVDEEGYRLVKSKDGWVRADNIPSYRK